MRSDQFYNIGLRLKEEARPVVDIEDILKSVEGNLCRCTGYRPILDAFSTFW
jgi:xanthine dehydrogenase iron-sulfur cluster and FAD-binding subunit A